MGDFWDLSLCDINLVIESYNKRFRDTELLRLYRMYELADLIGNRVAIVFSKKGEVEPITVEENHPEFFEEQDLEEQRKKIIGQKQAESRKAFAQRYNSILKERKENGYSQTTSSS